MKIFQGKNFCFWFFTRERIKRIKLHKKFIIKSLVTNLLARTILKLLLQNFFKLYHSSASNHLENFDEIISSRKVFSFILGSSEWVELNFVESFESYIHRECWFLVRWTRELLYILHRISCNEKNLSGSL